MARREAAIGTALFFVLAPGVVAGLVPWLITRWRMRAHTPASAEIVGWLLIVIGAAALIESFVRFVRQGGGTPAPVMPTRHLVVSGLYRFVRNPMYLGVLAVIFGQMLLFQNAGLMAYGIVIALAFHVFVVTYEEPTLRHSFADEYAAYCAGVGRWLPRLTPWMGP